MKKIILFIFLTCQIYSQIDLTSITFNSELTKNQLDFFYSFEEKSSNLSKNKNGHRIEYGAVYENDDSISYFIGQTEKPLIDLIFSKTGISIHTHDYSCRPSILDILILDKFYSNFIIHKDAISRYDKDGITIYNWNGEIISQEKLEIPSKAN